MNQNDQSSSLSWSIIGGWNNSSMQQTVQIWINTPARDNGTTLVIILYILILLIALSTWMRTLAIDCVFSTSSALNWPLSERKGGIFKVTSIGSSRSLMLNPLSAMQSSPFSNSVRIPLCFVMSLSEILPVLRSEINTGAPEGAIPNNPWQS